MRKKYYLQISLVFLMILLLGTLFVVSENYRNSEIGSNNLLSYHSSVLISKNGELISASENTLTDDGKDLIKLLLGDSGSGGPVQYIGLCNASAGCGAADSSSTTLDNEYASGNLSRLEGTYADIGTGNWTITKTFTASENDLITNKTGLFNATSGGTLFAENTFTLVTLQDDDELTVTWNIWVT